MENWISDLKVSLFRYRNSINLRPDRNMQASIHRIMAILSRVLAKENTTYEDKISKIKLIRKNSTNFKFHSPHIYNLVDNFVDSLCDILEYQKLVLDGDSILGIDTLTVCIGDFYWDIELIENKFIYQNRAFSIYFSMEIEQLLSLMIQDILKENNLLKHTSILKEDYYIFLRKIQRHLETLSLEQYNLDFDQIISIAIKEIYGNISLSIVH